MYSLPKTTLPHAATAAFLALEFKHWSAQHATNTMNQVSASFSPPLHTLASSLGSLWPHLVILIQHLDPEDGKDDRGDKGQDPHLHDTSCPTPSHLYAPTALSRSS